MFLCAIDLHRTSLRVVLSVSGPESMPVLLEGELFPRDVPPEQVLCLLENWRQFYGSDPEAVILSSRDRLSRELIDSLGDGPWELVWLDEREIRQVQQAWRAVRPDPRWQRGGLMAMLYSSPPLYRHPGDTHWKAAWDWIYACLRLEVRALETFLWAEGRMTCPMHVSPRCPDCGDFPGDSWDRSGQTIAGLELPLQAG